MVLYQTKSKVLRNFLKTIGYQPDQQDNCHFGYWDLPEYLGPMFDKAAVKVAYWPNRHWTILDSQEFLDSLDYLSGDYSIVSLPELTLEEINNFMNLWLNSDMQEFDYWSSIHAILT